MEEAKRGEAPRRASLGRGLSALFGDAEDDYAALDKVQTPGKTVPIELVRPGRYQPRRNFDPEEMESLIASVREKGILQPLLVRRDPEIAGEYELVAGERRWRAAQAAGLHEVPVVVRDLADRDALEIALIENVQRQDLTPLEEAEGYRRLMEEFQHTQEDLARSVGKSRSHVANMMRLLALPDTVKELMDRGDLTAGHARALLTAENAEYLAEEVVRRGLNVRQTEDLARGEKAKREGGGVDLAAAGKTAAPRARDPDLVNLEEEISAKIGLRVAINPQGRRGSITIHYQTLDQLDEVIRRLGDEAL
ncbi:MAG TPA: ParB/RepB/Spo0J family partition protein [Azospirillaceae bacterium]|nr:ParB/RepB/Spo0J family partition protein [Azospirillaceae bacterium]HRQ79760.1 ParB/RepB/Spo0J family partition protein [Azospirillaceae bacterium]